MDKSEASSTPPAGLGVYPRTMEAVPTAAAASERRPFVKKLLSALRVFAINFVIFAALAELAQKYGTPVDLHKHFLKGQPDWFVRTIEPSLAGASEVRRCFLEAIEAGGFV